MQRQTPKARLAGRGRKWNRVVASDITQVMTKFESATATEAYKVTVIPFQRHWPKPCKKQASEGRSEIITWRLPKQAVGMQN